MKVDARTPRHGSKYVRIELSRRTVEILEQTCHQRDCSMDTLICELIELSDMEKRKHG